MFDSLDEQIKKDEDRIYSSKERFTLYGLYALAAVLVFGGIIFVVQTMS